MLKPPVSDSRRPVAYEFGGFRLEPKRRILSHLDGGPVVLTDKAFDALVELVEHAGQLVTKDELLRALWPTTVVEENNLYAAISALRRALKDETASQRLIATVAGRGYQFVVDVRLVGEGATAADVSRAASPVSRKRHLPMIAAVVLAVAAGGAAVIAFRDAPESAPRTSGLTLAVLPFKPLTSGDRNESLEFGMAETLIAGLNTGNLSVRPLSSVRRYAGVEQDVLAAGRALDVQAVLDGHIQRAGDQLRVSARLLDVSDGRQLWSESYDEPFTDIFSVQDAIAERVRAALTVELAGQPSPSFRRYTEDAEAYQQYANGRFHLERVALPQALAHFEQAVARDPDFALAYVGMAEVRAMLGVFGAVAPHHTFPEARRAVEKALQIAPELGEAYASLAHIKVQYEHDWVGAARAYRRAIELNPNYARAQAWYGLYLALGGRFDEGIAQLRTAQALEPSQPVYSALIGMVLIYQRRYDEAIEQLQSTLEMDPNFPTTNTYLAMAHLRRGEYDKAMEHMGRMKSPAPGSAAYRGQIFALSGRRAEALQELERLVAMSKERYVPAYDIATIYAALGNADKTFEWLARAFEERSQLIGWLLWDPVFDDIRSDPRYTPLARRLVPAVSSRIGSLNDPVLRASRPGLSACRWRKSCGSRVAITAEAAMGDRWASIVWRVLGESLPDRTTAPCLPQASESLRQRPMPFPGLAAPRLRVRPLR
jgi:DNA-binding winged helix-turn-helix (wHTH) protein/TolB-like protein/Tfp pilus assembly protein PilF